MNPLLTLYFSAVRSPHNIFTLCRIADQNEIAPETFSLVRVEIDAEKGVVSEIHAIIVEPSALNEIEYFSPGYGDLPEFLLPGGSWATIKDTATIALSFTWIKAEILVDIARRIENFCGVGIRLDSIPDDPGLLLA